MMHEDAECTKHDPGLWLSRGDAGKARAKNICNTRCVMRQLCLERALDFQEASGEPLVGIVAGFTPEERMRMRRAS